MNENRQEKIKIGAALRALRMSKFLTQKRLGDLLGYSARTVSDWENNNTEPNIEAIVNLLHFYDITFEELIEP